MNSPSASSEVPVERLRWDALADAVLVADADAHYVDANFAAQKLLGYTLAELRTMTVSDVVAHGSGWSAEEYERFVAAGYWEGRLAVRSKSLNLIIVEARATVLRLHDRTEYLSCLRESWIPDVHLASPRTGTPSSPAPPPLSPRERDVIRLIAGGSSSVQIAAILSISARTADAHRLRIMRKLGLGSIAALTRFAIRHGLDQAD